MAGVSDTRSRLSLRLQANDEEKTAVADCIPEISLISDEQARSRCALIWSAAWKSSGFPDLLAVPSLPMVPVTPINNLIAHTRRVTRGCRALAEQIQRADGLDPASMDDLVEAAILHDVGKILEYEPDDGTGPHRYSELGEVMPHAATGAFWALEAGSSRRVARAIYVHTPGVAAAPDCLEAVILFAVDQCDADAARIGEALPPMAKRNFAGMNGAHVSVPAQSRVTNSEGH